MSIPYAPSTSVVTVTMTLPFRSLWTQGTMITKREPFLPKPWYSGRNLFKLYTNLWVHSDSSSFHPSPQSPKSLTTPDFHGRRDSTLNVGFRLTRDPTRVPSLLGPPSETTTSIYGKVDVSTGNRRIWTSIFLKVKERRFGEKGEEWGVPVWV